MTNSLQNASLNGCAYIVLPTMSMVAYLNRKDWSDVVDSKPSSVKEFFIRLLTFALPSSIFAIPAATVKKDMVGGSAIVIMFINYIIPMGVVACYSAGGWYDQLVHYLMCDKNEESAAKY
jgi:hypothetical protein